MKNQMKRFVAMLLASLAILALAGCSNSGNGDGDKADYPKENITVIVPYRRWSHRHVRARSAGRCQQVSAQRRELYA